MIDTPYEKVDFANMPRQRNAEFFNPPNVLKKKVGSGGVAPDLIAKAESYIENNEQDFHSIAENYFAILDEASHRVKDGEIKGAEAFEAVLYPLSQLKAQGAMFKQPIVTDLAAMLINFLEVIEELDDQAISILMVHKMTLQAVIKKKLPADTQAQQNQTLKNALRDACIRYFQNKKPG